MVLKSLKSSHFLQQDLIPFKQGTCKESVHIWNHQRCDATSNISRNQVYWSSTRGPRYALFYEEKYETLVD